jgi:tRNA pseudouridine38-40 synthase
MAAAAAKMVGTWDLGSLCCVSESNGPTTRTLLRLAWDVEPGLLTLEIEGDSFLYKQVRCMMGVLLAIGEGRYGVELVDRLLAGQPRPVPIAVAPPTGLVLERVLYGPRAGAEAGR